MRGKTRATGKKDLIWSVRLQGESRVEMVLADEIEEPGRSRSKGHSDLQSKRVGFGSSNER